MPDPKERFSSRADDYVKFRPSYPAGVIELLARECGLSPQSVVADIGSGTGLLTKLFLDFGCEVFGTEPNARMRRAGEAFLRSYSRFRSVDGSAEETRLADSSIDLVVAGQAFHWFDVELARVEFRRILRTPAWVVLIWNDRVKSGDAFASDYESLLRHFATSYDDVRHDRARVPKGVGEFFGSSGWKHASFENDQRFNLIGLRGRVLSSSYMPQQGSEAYEPMIADVDRLFETHHSDGFVTLPQTTNIYYGSLRLRETP